MIEDVKIIDNNRIEYKGEVLNVPHHIAVIPDGNRRWARERGLAPIFGHKEGVETYKKLLENDPNYLANLSMLPEKEET